MATKCITITESSYKKLLLKKENNESFSEVIDRLASGNSFSKLIGILTTEEGEEY
ncbi:hypothetical protein HYY69_01915 [Candidatus Woesearchaeota archaeon]|nr:hypothetical protein [Candidatus Woesearchaeota archaeon]